MSNRFLGEVTVEHDGTAYTLRMDFNAMCEFEDMTGQNAMKVFETAETGDASIKALRSIVHAALMRHHPDVDVAMAGDILSEDPNVVERLMAASAPQVDTKAAGKTAGKPRAGRTRAR